MGGQKKKRKTEIMVINDFIMNLPHFCHFPSYILAINFIKLVGWTAWTCWIYFR